MIFPVLFYSPQTDASALPSHLSEKSQDISSNSTATSNTADTNDLTETTFALPKQTPIPSRQDVNPQKADEVPPSDELKEIIKQVKNGTLPKASESFSRNRDTETSKEALAIIKKGGAPIKAEEIKPSAALKTVLDAYRNGSLTYAQRDIQDVEEELYYHQPYAEMDMASVFDLIVLRSGQDIFLSLGYQPLKQRGESEEETKSRRINELKLTIAAIKAKQERKKATTVEGAGELAQKTSVKVNIKPKKTFAKTVMDFFGIRRKDESINYEELSKTYRAYKRWHDHIQEVDKMFRRKRKQKIQLLHQRSYRPSKTIDCSDPANSGICTDRQLKINPYKNGNIRFLKLR